jgi:enoyl-CoA hydratase/carnithine racemase
MRLGLRAFYDTQDQELRPALDHLQGQLAAVLSTEDAAEGIAAFLGKREPVWKGR